MLALSEKDAKKIAGKGGYAKIAVSETSASVFFSFPQPGDLTVVTGV